MDNTYSHALNLIPNIGSKKIEMLVRSFGDSKAVWYASDNDILSLTHIPEEARDAFLVGRKKINPDQEWEKLRLSNISVFSKTDTGYPSLLRQIPDAPFTLYMRGNYDWLLDQPLIAIVGSRKYTSYGEHVAYRLAEDLARAGCVVVSGLAYGIDTLAHQAALEAGGATIAVMGNGLDDRSLYPKTNVSLAQKIATHNGCLLSEYPPLTSAAPYTFPARNRIIAGLTLGTIVIEAAEESGSLITAKLALDYDRSVFAVPGSIFSPVSVGTNRLIREGAKIVTSVRDILEEFPDLDFPKVLSENTSPTGKNDLSSEEKKILACLSHEPLHVDKIIQAATLETAAVNSLLSILEIKGFVKNIGGMNYIKPYIDDKKVS